jgi:hypothetical protein
VAAANRMTIEAVVRKLLLDEHATSGDMRLEHPRDRPRVHRRFHHSIAPGQARHKQRQALRRRPNPTRRSGPPALADRHLTEVPWRSKPVALLTPASLHIDDA